MKVSRLNTSLLVFLLTFFSITATARAFDDDDEPDDYDVKDRVVRISLITGDVSLKRKGNQDWESARLNYPLVEGDTIATDKDSRMEIQIDARNFVRLAPATALRIVTLRNEGVALGVIEGTAFVRLVKFDRSKEYFEVDAPRTTMAAEKPGLYRIDVPRDGRVRLTVRDGGSARIYSDTSGFSLRDGRAAELVLEGENAGDWDFLTARSHDANDEWVDDRERYLAQRLRYDVEYYDDYVWGAEELAAYGQWTYTNDFGWIWQPHPGTISAYGDWAPYRYGRWVWCPPYGWTWVGAEPWGWAPYHYGRWVYHNNAWAWVPRSQYNKKRSWWRPALVAFVSLNFSFGNDICWYPLSYYQHDPYSRRYRHSERPYPGRGGSGGYAGGGRPGGDGRPGYPGGSRPGGDGRYPGRGDGRPSGDGRYPRNGEGRTGAGGSGGVAGSGNGDRPGYPGSGNGRPGNTGTGDRPRIGGAGQPAVDYTPWRGVTRVPRRDFGNDDEPGRPVDERTARRVIESAPDVDDLPRRIGVPAGAVTGNGSRGRDGSRGLEGSQGRDGSRGRDVVGGPPRSIQFPEASTGAAERTPGVPLDDDLRRSRVFRGREPRTTEPGSSTTRTTPVTPTNRPNADSPDNGASNSGRSNTVAPSGEGPRSVEVPPSGAVTRPEPRSPRRENGPGREAGGRGNENPSEPRIEPRSESPRYSPRTEPRSESPRSEPRTEPRRESPRSEPRTEPRSESPRSEPRTEPRSESPRSEPRTEPRSESPRSDRPQRVDPPARSDPRPSEPRPEPRPESPRSEPAPRVESPRNDPPPRSEPAPRNDPPPRSEPPPRNDPPPRSEPAPRSEPRSESPRSDEPRKPDKPRF